MALPPLTLSRDEFREMKIPCSKGAVLYGPPGNCDPKILISAGCGKSFIASVVPSVASTRAITVQVQDLAQGEVD